ncbi:uncharacterized protein LOC123312752 [Coccinella septempunctata]|uniref:uncharacterized protein LOC123312752 n=1 Tax=Coccinella septempunctata TaxID=41139 RepID=UPI001D066931|nr:uncharacterized protein LOC123312752 [Coccinella septempunctata]
MAMSRLMTVFCNLIILTILSLVTFAIHLPNQPTDRPHKFRISSTTVAPASGVSNQSSESKDGVATYRFINSNTGTTCILMRTDAVVEVKFRLHNLEEQADSFIPEKALVEGNCKNEDSSYIRLSWTGYSLIISFAKSPGGELWYIDKVELTVSPDLPQLKGVKIHGNAIKLYRKTMVIPTPVGKSYSCEELVIDLETDKEDRPPPGLRGSLLLRAVQLQPFMYKSDKFEPSVECKEMRTYRDETAPLAVGTTLAIFVLMTISGYAIFRYFKVKNVQYNTME